MDQTHNSELPSHPIFEKQKVSFWRKLGGGSLTISLIIHGIILAIGVYLVVQVIPKPPEPKVDFLPKSGGGGTPAAPPSAQKVKVNTPQSNASRIAAKGASSAFTLPEPDASSDMNALSSLDSGSLSGGMGGKGSGGGAGTGNGLGVGDGMGIGISSGTGSGSPFGVTDPKAGGLTGVLYDLKQTKNGKPSGLNDNQVLQVINEFVTKGWKERFLETYFKAPQQLKQTRVMLPNMEANKAPEAFNCEKEVKPSKWVVLYKGVVIAPKTGKFRFVGAGDDVLAVRFSEKMVFDYGYSSAAMGRGITAMKNNPMDKELEKLARRELPMQFPIELRRYTGISRFGSDLGGLGVGKTFEVVQNTAYPIEILISEIPGGRFSAMLLIEEVGATYSKTDNSLPLIPVFRTNGELPAESKELPPFEKNSPIWKIATGGGALDI